MEHGFWDYTCPAAGGMEQYRKDDYMRLLDDMSEFKMDSLAIIVRWNTNGYRSTLPFVDQLPGNPVIESDNQLLRDVIAEAKKRGIKIWLGGCAMTFDPKVYGGTPWRVNGPLEIPGYGMFENATYDTDTPGFGERAADIFREIVTLFPGIHGLIVEVEDTNAETPERIPLYNAWAAENRRPQFEQLRHPLIPRLFDVRPWRDYTTYSRIKVLKQIETAVREAGFGGAISSICETGQTAYLCEQDINLRMYHQSLPEWSAVTYEYDKAMHRYGMMDMCIDTVKKEGIPVYYLPRGVMSWGWKGGPELRTRLESNWRMDAEDIRMFKPDGVWWFGTGSVSDGCHVSLTALKEAGFRDGADARRAMLKIISEY